MHMIRSWSLRCEVLSVDGSTSVSCSCLPFPMHASVRPGFVEHVRDTLREVPVVTGCVVVTRQVIGKGRLRLEGDGAPAIVV